MKKKIAIASLIILLSGNAHAWNWNIFGSDDKQKKRRPVATQTQPNNPVSVPEPTTLTLLGAGLVALIIAKKNIK